MAKPLCPLLKKPCIEHECKFWVHVQGMHPQSKEVVNRFDCTFAWFPFLLIENSKMQRETGAAVESLRNEIAAGAGSFLAAALSGQVTHTPRLVKKDGHEDPG